MYRTLKLKILFSHLEFIAPALAVAGLLIVIAGIFEKRRPAQTLSETNDLNMKQAGLIGAIQGLCLPFRGFSRSGATISTGMLLGVAKSRAEAFSFALAVVLTPAVVVRETPRLIKSAHINPTADLASITSLRLLAVVVAFLVGIPALSLFARGL